MRDRLNRALVLGLAAALALPPGAWAQSVAEGQIAPIKPVKEQPSIGFGEGSFIAAPIPFSSPMIGAGLALGGAYLFKMDEESNSSTIGLGGMKSDNGSQAFGFSASVAFGENRWQASLLAARADLNYDLISSLGTVPINQGGLIGRLELAYGFTPEFSIGFQSRYLQTDIQSQGSGALPPDIQPQANLTVASYGLIAEYDARDDDIYATRGTHINISALQSEIIDGIGNGDSYGKAYATWDMFRPLGSRAVLAVRLAACAAQEDTPFYDLCSIGGTDNMRGYNVTQFLDERLLSAQVELRARVTDRIGIVAFAGTGAVGESFDALDEKGSAGGVGVRYRVSKKFPVEFAIDLSQNEFNEQLLYISVGQRF